MNGWEKIFYANGKQKRAGVAILKQNGLSPKQLQAKYLYNDKGVHSLRTRTYSLEHLNRLRKG